MTAGAPVRVMIVEDSLVVRELLNHIVARDPRFRVVAAVASAEEALAEIPRLQPDVISMDIRLPGMDGLELCNRIRKTGATVPIVVITSYSDKEMIQRAKTLGLAGWLLKPVTPEALIQKANSALGTA